MKYLSLNRPSDFEYHDAALCLKNHENHHLCVTAKYLNIHKNIQENLYHYDMEIASAEMTFENIEIRSLKTMELYCFRDDGSRYLEEPQIVYTGAKAEEELITALKKGICLDCIAVSKEGDNEYLYEFMTGAITDNPANAEKFKRLRERQFLSEDNHVNIMVMKEKADDFFEKIPEVDETITKQFADAAFEYAQIVSQDYPPQMRDLIICWKVGEFGGNTTALMVMDILYGNGTFRPLTEQERITSNLILFTDVLPSETQK